MSPKIDTISRRDFLRSFPQEIIHALRSFAGQSFQNDSFKESAQNDYKVSGGLRRAVIDIEKCLAWQGSSCQLCYLACPLREQAITMNDQKPVIASLMCDGCAMCAAACLTVNDLQAIKLVNNDAKRT